MLDKLRKKFPFDHPLRMKWHKTKGVLASTVFRKPGRELVVIGVTGTNGKTTTTHMIEHILRRAGKKVAMLSTVEFSIQGQNEPNKTHKTTLSPFKTQKFLRQCAKQGIDYAVIEVSSHALHQSRLHGIPFSMGVFTNLTHEHLDYHGSMEAYCDAKLMLFQNIAANADKPLADRVAEIPHHPSFILNQTDNFYDYFNAIDIPNKINFGLQQGFLHAQDIKLAPTRTEFNLMLGTDGIPVNLPLAGTFNIENALAATGVALACEVDPAKIKSGLETFPGVPGRMERIQSPNGFEVIVDFALTADSLEKLYSNLRATAPSRLIGIIGSCGDRDKEKRPALGRIVAENTDLTIVTDEEPYSEDPKTIMQQVLQGAQQAKTLEQDLFLIEDRYNAIDFAVKNAQPGDTIVVTGMGAFDNRVMNNGTMKWDEREVVKEIISKNSTADAV